MKKLGYFLACLSLLGFTDCIQAPRTALQERRELVEDLRLKTVALVTPSATGPEINCSGVWVGKNLILTARHCIDDARLHFYQIYGDKDVVRKAIVVKEDVDNDLGLLVTEPASTPLEHPIAKVANDVWDGEVVNIEGHTIGLGWTYVSGVVSSSRIDMEVGREKFPKLLQVSSPAWMGNSGGGAFDNDGRLVGLCSWVNSRAPLMSFFIHRDELEKFLLKP